MKTAISYSFPLQRPLLCGCPRSLLYEKVALRLYDFLASASYTLLDDPMSSVYYCKFQVVLITVKGAGVYQGVNVRVLPRGPIARTSALRLITTILFGERSIYVLKLTTPGGGMLASLSIPLAIHNSYINPCNSLISIRSCAYAVCRVKNRTPSR